LNTDVDISISSWKHIVAQKKTAAKIEAVSCFQYFSVGVLKKLHEIWGSSDENKATFLREPYGWLVELKHSMAWV
jgi:hypothetical protein